VFAPRREHARFCSARCRVAWNRENTSERMAEASALDWSITAMRDVTGRLVRLRARAKPRAFTLISEAVWWVTIVDGTLLRYDPEAYDGVLAGHALADRRLIEGTFAGLRFVRNQMGQDVDHVDFIHPEASHSGHGHGSITKWTWTSVPEPALASLPPHRREWEMSRYQAYEAHLAGRTVGDVFGRAVPFLELVAARATQLTAVGEHAARQ
jgi:hypothetical protein